MPAPVKLDYKELKEYFLNNKRDVYYKDCLDMYKDFLVHSDGIYPEGIIERQRPNEPAVVKEFRKEIWQPITKPTFSRVINSLNKIRRSSDWSIKYPQERNRFSLITDGETLQDYCETKYPFFTSLTNWVFSLLLKPYLIDPNGVILIMPLDINVDENEYLQPYASIFNCCDVYKYVEDQYAILSIKDGSERLAGGTAFYFINTRVIERWEQVSNRTFTITAQYEHGLDMLPVFKMGGIICKSTGYNFIYESRISGILPNLNESVAEYTDLQAGKRLHVYPERWEATQHECAHCKGAGVVPNPNFIAGSNQKPKMVCGTCGGLGFLGSTPYSKILVRPPEAGKQPLPNPPAGFIEKDVEIIKIMDESWRRHIYDALSAINFQFLDQSPLNQSGIAKEVDKDELNNTVHGIAEDLVKIMDKIYFITALYRYKTSYAASEIRKMLPSISVPDHFDLLSSAFMQDEITKAKSGKINPTMVSAMEVEFAGKRFINEPEVKQRLELVLKLDPLPNVTEEEKMSMLSNKGVTQLNYIISSNIQAFIQRAVFENTNFSTFDLKKQIEILEGYAQDQIDSEKQAQLNAIKNQQSNTPMREVSDPEEEQVSEEDALPQLA